MDACALVQCEKRPHVLVDLDIDILDHMKAVVADHNFFFAADGFVSLDCSFVEFNDLSQLILLSFLGAHDD